MKRLIALMMCALSLGAAAQSTITYPYNPDGNADGDIAVGDLQDFLGTYGNPFSPSEIMVGDTALSEWIQILYSATSDSPVSSVSSTPSASPPYVWGTNYIQQVNPSDPYLVGSYKQIRSALFIWSGDEGISYGVPNNTANPLSGQQSLSPPCQGGGELLKLGTPKIWDLPSVNYYAPYHTFSIPALASRTMMTVELSIDIWYDSTGQDRVNTVLFWLGKNGGTQPAVEGGGTGPMAFRMATHMPSYFGTNNMEPTFCHTASITLLGSEGNPVGPAALLNDFDSGDIFYITAQAVGSPSFPRYKNLRVKVTWEAVN